MKRPVTYRVMVSDERPTCTECGEEIIRGDDYGTWGRGGVAHFDCIQMADGERDA